jgi:PAS domain S-box-containing protein
MSVATRTPPSGHERFFGLEEIIVSKTDRQGRIMYANDVFLRVSGYEEEDLRGAPHSIIRHPDMPRAVFKLLWDSVESGVEIFAYVNNLARSGEHYWVLAHVTPSFSNDGQIVGFHSNRRCPERSAIEKIAPIYDELRDIERSFTDRKDGLVASAARLEGMLAAAGMSYHEWVWTL